MFPKLILLHNEDVTFALDFHTVLMNLELLKTCLTSKDQDGEDFEYCSFFHVLYVLCSGPISPLVLLLLIMQLEKPFLLVFMSFTKLSSRQVCFGFPNLILLCSDRVSLFFTGHLSLPLPLVHVLLMSDFS